MRHPVSIKRTGSLNYFEGFYHPDCFFHVLNNKFLPPCSFFHVLKKIFAPPCSLITSCSLNRYYRVYVSCSRHRTTKFPNSESPIFTTKFCLPYLLLDFYGLIKRLYVCFQALRLLLLPAGFAV